jgi:hypothetical protein
MVKGTDAQMISYDPGTGHAEVYLNEDANDEEAIARNDSFPVEMYTTRQAIEELLAFIDTQLDVMNVLKIHHLSKLSAPVEDIRRGIEHVLSKPEEESEPPF